MPENNRDNLDLLLHIEKLTEQLNSRMAPHSQSAFKRYPITFALVALFGVVAVSEGIKSILEEIPMLQDSPVYMLLLGLLILVTLGLVYRKLED